MSDTLIERCRGVVFVEIAERTSDACSDAEVAELAITHEHAVRKLGSIGLQRILDVSDREAYLLVQCTKLSEFVAQRLRISRHARGCGRSPSLLQLHSMTKEKLPPRNPETADAMADGDLTHEHVDAVLDVMAQGAGGTPPEVRDLAIEEQLAEIARHHAPRDILRAGARILHPEPRRRLHPNATGRSRH